MKYSQALIRKIVSVRKSCSVAFTIAIAIRNLVNALMDQYDDDYTQNPN